MMLTAIYKDKETGLLNHIKSDYPTKKSFQEDLRKNGYVPYVILRESQIEETANEYYDNWSFSKSVSYSMKTRVVNYIEEILLAQ